MAFGTEISSLSHEIYLCLFLERLTTLLGYRVQTPDLSRAGCAQPDNLAVVTRLPSLSRNNPPFPSLHQ